MLQPDRLDEHGRTCRREERAGIREDLVEGLVSSKVTRHVAADVLRRLRVPLGMQPIGALERALPSSSGGCERERRRGRAVPTRAGPRGRLRTRHDRARSRLSVEGRGVAAANVAPESPVERDAKVQIIGENLAAWRKVEPMVQTLGVHQTAVAYVDALVRQRRVLASLEFWERLLPPPIPGTPPPQPGREPPPVFYLADSERIRFNEARAEYLQFWDPLASLCSRPR